MPAQLRMARQGHDPVYAVAMDPLAYLTSSRFYDSADSKGPSEEPSYQAQTTD